MNETESNDECEMDGCTKTQIYRINWASGNISEYCCGHALQMFMMRPEADSIEKLTNDEIRQL